MSDITLRFPGDVSMPAIGGVVKIEDTPFGEGEVLTKGKMWTKLEDGFEATYTKEELEFCLALADWIAGDVSVQTESVQQKEVIQKALDRFGSHSPSAKRDDQI